MRYFTNKLNALLENEFDFLDTDVPVQDGDDSFECFNWCDWCGGEADVTRSVTCVKCNREYCHSCLANAVDTTENGCDRCCSSTELWAGYNMETGEYTKPQTLDENEFDFLDTDEPVQDGADDFTAGCPACGHEWSWGRDGEGYCSYCGEYVDADGNYIVQEPESQYDQYTRLSAEQDAEDRRLGLARMPLREDEFDFLDTDEPVQHGDDNFDDPAQDFHLAMDAFCKIGEDLVKELYDKSVHPDYLEDGETWGEAEWSEEDQVFSWHDPDWLDFCGTVYYKQPRRGLLDDGWKVECLVHK